jgi:hypothetical protein
VRRETLRDNTSGTLLDGATFSVAPVSAAIVVMSLANTFVRSVYFMVEPQDPLQVFSGYIETAPTLSGPWARTGNTAFLDVDPSDPDKSPAAETIQSADVPYIRISGSMSGAGANLKVWAIARVETS